MSKIVTGNSIYIDDGCKAPLVDFELEGKTTQETRSGKNLMPNIATSRTVNGITYTVNKDGTVIANGTATSRSSLNIAGNSLILDSGTYTFSGCPNGGIIGTSYWCYAKIGSSAFNFNDSKTVTNGGNVEYSITIENGYTANNLLFKPQIEQGSTATEYEQYGVQPSPDYPSELVSVGYENLSPIAKISTTNGGYLNRSCGELGNVTAGEIYTISFTYSNLYAGANQIQVRNYSSSSTVNEITTTYNSGNRFNGTFTATQDGVLFISASLGTDYTDIIYDIQLAKGTQQHSYIPYGKYGIEVKTTGKNLFNSSTSTLNKYLDTNGNLQNSSISGVSDYIDVSDLDDIYIYYNGTNIVTKNIAYYDSDKTFITYGTYTTSTTKNVSNFSFIRFTYIMADNNKVMIIAGNTAPSDYELYQSNTQLYQLDNPLRSIGDTKDLAYIKNGMLYVERKIGYQKILSSMSMSIANTLTYSKEMRVLLTNIENFKITASSKLFSNCFKGQPTWGSDVIGIMGFAGNPVNSVAFRIPVNDDKTFFDNNEVYLQYELETSYTEELGQVPMPSTYKGITYLNTTDDLQPNMNITYVNDLSQADKDALRSNTAAIKCQLIVQEQGDLPEIILTEDNSVKDWEYTDERLVPGKGFIGQFVARTLDGNLQNITDDFDIDGRRIKLMFGVYRMNDNHESWYDFGNFIITEPEDDEVRDNTSFETMDYTKLFNKDFDGDYTDDEFPTSYNNLMGVGLTEKDRATFTVTPVTALWVARYACKQVGVELATINFTNADFEIDINPFQAGESCRDVMKAIGQLAFSWVRIGWDNRCYIDFGLQTDVDEHDVLDNNQYFSLSTKETVAPVDGVAFGMKNIDGETAFKTKDDIPIDEAKNVIYLYDNPFLYTYELRDKAVGQGTVLFGLTYTQLKSETIGHPWFVGTELINVKNMEDEDNFTYPFNTIIKYSGHIRSEISSMDESEVEKTLGYTSDTVKTARMATIEVNKQEGTITSLTGTISTIKGDMGNTYTKSEVNELLQDAAGLTNRYITSGGANKFRNTGLWYKEGTEFEYWDGSVEVVNETNSASSTAMLLQNSALTQTLTNTPNGDYTISFRYEQLNSTSSLKVLINSTDYSEQLNNGKFEQVINVTTNSIELSLICDTENGYKVYELMCNVGSAPLPWTQYPNEVRTDTVNISKGITVTSSINNNEIYFKADYDGVRIVNQSEHKTTEFTDDGMITDNATIRKQAKVSGALHTIVGNQTWISGVL